MYLKPLSVLCGVLSLSLCVNAGPSVSKDQRYIVQLKSETDIDSFVPNFLKNIFDLIGDLSDDGDDDVSSMANPVQVFDSFDIGGGFKAISTEIKKDSLLGAMLGYFDDIVEIVPDDVIQFDLPKPESSRRRRNEKRRLLPAALDQGNGTAGGTVEQEGATWSLARVSQRKANPSEPYVYPEAAGDGVYVYVLDDGVYKDHNDFGGRASWGFSAIGNDSETQTGGGHGTHVAGIIGGEKYGVAKKATIVSVQVLDLEGSGSMSQVIAGLDWTVKDAKKHAKKSVLNMSLGAPSSAPGTDTLNKALSAAAKELPIIVAAGNSGDDACLNVPAGNPDVFTVAASDKTDALDPRSCYGKCVDVTAPGIEVESDYIGGKDKTEILSGTSMAAPHLTGIAALLLQESDYASPEDLFKDLVSIATKDVVEDNRPETPNLLAYNRKD